MNKIVRNQSKTIKLTNVLKYKCLFQDRNFNFNLAIEKIQSPTIKAIADPKLVEDNTEAQRLSATQSVNENIGAAGKEMLENEYERKSREGTADDDTDEYQTEQYGNHADCRSDDYLQRD